MYICDQRKYAPRDVGDENDGGQSPEAGKARHAFDSFIPCVSWSSLRSFFSPCSLVTWSPGHLGTSTTRTGKPGSTTNGHDGSRVPPSVVLQSFDRSTIRPFDHSSMLAFSPSRISARMEGQSPRACPRSPPPRIWHCYSRLAAATHSLPLSAVPGVFPFSSSRLLNVVDDII